MYVFLVLGLPLGFLLLVLAIYPHGEIVDFRRAYLRGLAASIPVWFGARILGSLIPAAYGSVLLAFHEWADHILPYAALPAAVYLIFYRYSERLQPGLGERRITAFYAGALSPVGLGEMVRIWGRPDAYTLLLLPILLGSIALAMPRIVQAAYEAYGARLVMVITGAVLATLTASLGPWLFLARLWPLAWLLTAAAGLAAWFLAEPGLVRRSPQPLNE